uniref:Uncharacterized protein n=1 Tax=Alexandrium catenella TaxID=2925 RepID=A0A7S1PSE9_ALECA
MGGRPTEVQRRGCLADMPAFLLAGKVVPFLKLPDLGCLCSTQAAMWQETDLLIGGFAAAHHGIESWEAKNFTELGHLEDVPSFGSIDVSTQRSLPIGRPRSDVPLGGIKGTKKQSDIPARGRCCEVSMQLRRGSYLVSVFGYSKPNGISELSLDGNPLIGGHSLERSDLSGTLGFAAFKVRVERTGSHTWRFATAVPRHSVEEQDVRLARIQVEPVDIGQRVRGRCGRPGARGRQQATRSLRCWASRGLRRVGKALGAALPMAQPVEKNVVRRRS